MITHIIILVVGIIFGACLVLAGLSDPDRISRALRLNDIHIIRTVIVFLLFALVGTWIIKMLGTAEINNKPASILTMIIGGLLVGAGMGLTGYSPCTSLAGAASGRIDAIITILGMFFGAYVYVFIYPPVVQPLESLYNYGKVTLPEITGFSTAIWIIIILALGSFVLILSFIQVRREAEQTIKIRGSISNGSPVNEGFFDEHSPKMKPRGDILLSRTDFINATQPLRFWKNLLFLIMIICLLILQISFWLVSKGYIVTGSPNGEQIHKNIGGISFNITFGQLTTILNISNALLVLAAVLYVLVIFFCLSTSFGAPLDGLRYISRAFFSALAALVLLLPWQILFGTTVSGAIYSPSELFEINHLNTGQIFGAVMLYLRFVGYWTFVTFLLVRSQVYSRRWTKSQFGRIKILI